MFSSSILLDTIVIVHNYLIVMRKITVFNVVSMQLNTMNFARVRYFT